MIDGNLALKDASLDAFELFSDQMESIPSFPAVMEKQYMNNTKIARVISTKNMDIADSERRIEIKIKDDILNFVDLWADQNISLSQKVTPFDMAVMDAAYTIFNHGNQFLTAEWIAKVLSGNQNQKVTPQKLDVINKSLDKLRNIHIRINAQNELNNRKDTKGKVTEFIYESYLLPLDKITAVFKANGKRVVAYSFLQIPALYRYGEVIHQIIEIPASYLDTQKLFNDTDEAILIKRYVVKRVFQIINQKNKLTNNRIAFEWYENNGTPRGLYAELGYKPDESKLWRTKTKPMINKIVKNTLKTLKTQGAIKHFKEYRRGGSNNPSEPVMGYEIFFNC